MGLEYKTHKSSSGYRKTSYSSSDRYRNGGDTGRSHHRSTSLQNVPTSKLLPLRLGKETFEGMNDERLQDLLSTFPENDAPEINGHDEIAEERRKEKEEMQKKMLDLEEKLTKYAAELDANKRKYDADREMLKSEARKAEERSQMQETRYQAKIAEARELQKQVEEARDIKDEIDRLKEMHKKQERAMREEYDRKLGKTILDYEEKLQEAKNKKEQDVANTQKVSESLKRFYEDKMQKKEKEFEKKVEEIQKESDMKIQEIRNEYGEKLRKVTKEHEAKVHEIEEIQMKMRVNIKEEQDRSKTLQREIDTIKGKAELNEGILRGEYKEKIAILQQNIEELEQQQGKKQWDKTEEFKKAYGEKIQEIRDRYDEKVKVMTKEHEAEILDMKEEMERQAKARPRRQQRPKEWVVPEVIYEDERLKTILHELMEKVDDDSSISPCPSSSINISHYGRVLLPVVAASRLGSDMSAAMDKAKLGSVPAIVLVFHHLAPHNSRIGTATKDRLSDRQLVERCQDIIDLVFWNGAMYDCDANRNALVQLQAIAEQTFNGQ